MRSTEVLHCCSLPSFSPPQEAKLIKLPTNKHKNNFEMNLFIISTFFNVSNVKRYLLINRINKYILFNFILLVIYDYCIDIFEMKRVRYF